MILTPFAKSIIPNTLLIQLLGMKSDVQCLKLWEVMNILEMSPSQYQLMEETGIILLEVSNIILNQLLKIYSPNKALQLELGLLISMEMVLEMTIP